MEVGYVCPDGKPEHDRGKAVGWKCGMLGGVGTAGDAGRSVGRVSAVWRVLAGRKGTHTPATDELVHLDG